MDPADNSLSHSGLGSSIGEIQHGMGDTGMYNPDGSVFDPVAFAATLSFDEPDIDHNMLRDADGQSIKGASFCKIISKMVDPQNFEVKFVMDMLFTYRSFATSFEVLTSLIHRFEKASGPDKGIILIRVCNVLNLWLDKVFYDFEKDCPALSDQLTTFLDRCMKDPDTKTSKVATSVHSVLMKRLKGEGRIRGDENTITVGKAPLPHLPKDPGATPLVKMHAEEIARQLTLLEWSMWREIRAWECLGLAWTKKDKEARAPHICESQNRFNRISNWVATTVCSTEKLADRAKALSKFIEVAVYLSKLNNFSGTLQIISGLSNSAVHRLTSTWGLISSAQRRQFEELLKLNEKNSRVLRDRIRNANPPCIPFFGMYQTDLTFVEEGNPDFIGPHGNLHNCTKRRLTADIIRSIHQYQLQPYVLAPLEFIQDMILSAPVLDDDGLLYDMSEWLEPRKGAEAKRPAQKPQGFDLQASMASSSAKVELELLIGYPYYVADAPSNIQINPNTHAIKYATTNKIVEHLTHNSNPDSASLDGFMASFRSFMSPSELFELIEKRWNMPGPKDKSSSGTDRFVNEFQRPIFMRVTNLLKTWIEKHYYDFEEDGQLMKRLQAFVASCVMPFSATLTKAIQRVESGNTFSQDETAPPPPSLPMPGFDPAFATLLDIEPFELARQMTLAIHSQFDGILPRECMDRASKGPLKDTKAPNVLRLLNYNESMTLWFEDQLQKADELGVSVTLLTRLLEILEHSATALRNWQLVNIVVDAIQAFLPDNNPGVRFANLSPQLWTAYDKYRQILADPNKRRDALSAAPPAILPLRYILSEIELIEDRFGKDTIGNLVNLEKRRAAGDVCVKMMQLQRVHYNLTPVPIIQQMIDIRHKHYVVMIGAEGASPSQTRNSSVLVNGGGPSDALVPVVKQHLMDLIGTDEDFRHELARCMADIFGEDMLEQARNIALGAQHEFVIIPRVQHQLHSSGGFGGQLHSSGGFGHNGGLSDSIGSMSLSSMNTSFSLASGRPPSVNGSDQLFVSQSSFGKIKLSHIRGQSSFVLGMNKHRAGSPPPNELSPELSPSSPSSSSSLGSQLITVPVDANGIMTLRPIPNADETLFAEASTLLQKEFSGVIESVSFFDDAGEIYGKPAHISLDVIIKNQHHYLCSFSSIIKEYDVQLLVQVGKLYKHHVPSCALACIVVTRSIPPEVRATADRYKMKVYVISESS